MQILHLEYSAFFRKIIHDMLIESGFNAISTKSGQEAYKVLAQDDIDLIITGLELADMTGEALIEELRDSKYQNIPIVVITASDMTEVRQRLKGVFIDDFILKPQLTQERLEDVISRLT